MTHPDYPLIIVYNNEALNIIPAESYLSKATPFGLVRPAEREVAFDGKGNKWIYRLTSAQFKGNVVTRLLAYILYNPVIIVKPEWTKQDNYQLQELKEVISQCVDKDDDIITQFADADTIKKAINKANSFQDLYKILNKYVFEADEDELLKEQEQQK